MLSAFHEKRRYNLKKKLSGWSLEEGNEENKNRLGQMG